MEEHKLTKINSASEASLGKGIKSGSPARKLRRDRSGSSSRRVMVAPENTKSNEKIVAKS